MFVASESFSTANPFPSFKIWVEANQQVLVATVPICWTFVAMCCRSAGSPFQLVSRFADHPEIGTLHDNFICISQGMVVLNLVPMTMAVVVAMVVVVVVVIAIQGY
nr:uncharacterized protein LOC125419732 [Ziziphus jujuba var. spinosa]